MTSPSDDKHNSCINKCDDADRFPLSRIDFPRYLYSVIRRVPARSGAQGARPRRAFNDNCKTQSNGRVPLFFFYEASSLLLTPDLWHLATFDARKTTRRHRDTYKRKMRALCEGERGKNIQSPVKRDDEKREMKSSPGRERVSVCGRARFKHTHTQHRVIADSTVPEIPRAGSIFLSSRHFICGVTNNGPAGERAGSERRPLCGHISTSQKAPS